MMKEATDTLTGNIERVTFYNEENGFSVLRVKAKGQRDEITVIGHCATANAGEWIECLGNWVNDKRHGLQFQAQTIRAIPPSTVEGIRKYLGSGLIKGIGPHYANKLVQAFADRVFDVIEQQPEKLLTIAGIGAQRQQKITTAWREQKFVREIMVFLHSHQVGTMRAVRIYKTYGERAIEIVRENPYRLSLDIRGIGFKTADQLAKNLGFKRDAPIRIEAGTRHVLQKIATDGHCAATHDKLVKKSCELLEVEPSLVESAIAHEVQLKHLIQDTVEDQPCYFLASLYHAEIHVAKALNLLNQGQPIWGEIDADKAISWVENENRIALSESQRNAVKLALQAKVMIITGGPGVGKTTLINSILKILKKKQIHMSLCAPTGRAAKRLNEATGLEAKTIHRLLEFDPKNYGFKYNADHPLNTQLVVVDEASMVDITLMRSLISAIPIHASVLVVGDVDQLPSVGPGIVLADLIQSETLPTVRLTEIFRQAAESQIIVNAHRINQGKMLLPTATHTDKDKLSDFYFIEAESPEEIHAKLIQVVSQRIPQRFNLHPVRDIQVLTPMNRGGLGARTLNIELQKKLNSTPNISLSRYGQTYAPGDKVIQLVNNYDLDIFNGDIGYIEKIDAEEETLHIDFDGCTVVIEANDLDDMALAYATTIHKSQGSEYPAVVIPLGTQHFTLLERNLLYTGVTRGKKLVVIIGQSKALSIAIHTNNAQRRLTKLAQRLRDSQFTTELA